MWLATLPGACSGSTGQRQHQRALGAPARLGRDPKAAAIGLDQPQRLRQPEADAAAGLPATEERITGPLCRLGIHPLAVVDDGELPPPARGVGLDL